MQIALIIKGISSFYYCLYENEIFECKARGIFKKDKITLACGDFVTLENIDFSSKTATIMTLIERKNHLIRPSISNIDIMFILISNTTEKSELINLDKLLIIAKKKEITPIIVIAKCDLKTDFDIENIYKNTDFTIVKTSAKTNLNIDKIKALAQNKTSLFLGQSGAGKSSLLNKIDEKLNLKTNEISRSLGRGKHTTRETELFMLDKNTFIADSPGFSTIDLTKYDVLEKSEIASFYPDFSEYIYDCKFSDCSHTKENNCALKEAVNDGKVNELRYNNFIKVLKEYETKSR